MTPQERDLIMKVAQRLRQAGPGAKDEEAERFIREQIASQPDAVYTLTQAVIIQEYGLQQAQERIGSLENDLEQARRQGSSGGQGGGSFLGGLFGGGSPSSSEAHRPAGQAGPRGAQRTTPQGRGAAPSTGGGFGDFMRSAAAMAVGVAGGHMLFSGLQGMFGDEGSGEEGAADVAQEAGDSANAEDAGGWGSEPADDWSFDQSIASEQDVSETDEDAGGWDSGDGGWDDGGGDDWG